MLTFRMETNSVKVIIAGSQTIYDMAVVENAIYDSRFLISEVVWGGARGVDELGKKWAEANDVPVKPFPAQWGLFGQPEPGKKDPAGMIRNSEMAKYADALIAIWDGKSNGTLDMIVKAHKQKLRIYVVTVVKD